MSLTANIIWQCTDPKATALILGSNKSFDDLAATLQKRFILNLKKFAKRFNRDELLPTTQNILAKTGSKAIGVELDEVIQKSLELTDSRLKEIEDLAMEAMVDVS